MKKISLKMVAMIAAMMMCLTADAMTEDVGGRPAYGRLYLYTRCNERCGWLLPDYEYRRLLHPAILVHWISHQVC